MPVEVINQLLPHKYTLKALYDFNGDLRTGLCFKTSITGVEKNNAPINNCACTTVQ